MVGRGVCETRKQESPIFAGLRHGQVIGSTDRHGYDIASRPVSPSDLAATVYQHLGIDSKSDWVNRQGRPISIVTEGGTPISELS